MMSACPTPVAAVGRPPPDDKLRVRGAHLGALPPDAQQYRLLSLRSISALEFKPKIVDKESERQRTEVQSGLSDWC